LNWFYFLQLRGKRYKMKPLLVVFLLLASALTASAGPSPLGPIGKGLPPSGDRSPVFTPSWEAWQTKAHLPESLCGNVVVPVFRANKNYVYSFGGEVLRGGVESYIDSIYIYDIAADSWARSSVHMPRPLGWAGGIATGGRVYVFGGWTGSGIVNTLNIFNPADSSWTQGAPLPVPCTDPARFVYQDSLIYVLGGVRTFWTRFSEAVQIYNRNQDTWVSGTPLPRQYGGGGAGVVGNTAVFSCGMNYTAGALFMSDTTYEGAINPANPTQITWTTITGSPYPGGTRFRVTSGTVEGQVFVGNGWRDTTWQISNRTYSYDPSAHAWTRHADKPTTITNVANYAIVDSVLYVPGGFGGAVHMMFDVHEALNLKITGLEEWSGGKPLSPEQFRARPNPFTSFATLPGHEAERFSLYDVSGRKVGVYKGDRVGEGLAPGVYFLRQEGKNAEPLRIVKVR
jgi:N-acetylneuraminic acid mutarotase